MTALWLMGWAALGCAGPAPLEEPPEPATAPAIAIWPERPEAEVDDLVCYVSAGWQPGAAYRVRWSVGGALFEGARENFMAGDTVPADATEGGQRWRCEVVASSGGVDAEPVWDEVLVHAPYAGWDGPDQRLDDAGLVLRALPEIEPSTSGQLGFGAITLDSDGDGRDEVALAAWGFDEASAENAGRVWIVRPHELAGDWRLEEAAFSALRGGAQDYAGESMAAGDVDGDGLDDLLVSAGGRCGAWLMLGRGAGPGERALASAEHYFYESSSSRCTVRVAAGGDMDGDGVDDLLIAVISGDSQGRVYGLRSKRLDELGAGEHELWQAADFVLTGDGRESLGRSLAFVPDLDADGRDEVAVFAADSNSIYLYRTTGALRKVAAGALEASTYDIRIEGYWSTDIPLVGLEDVDGDGRGDLLVGDPDASRAGEAHLYLGKVLESAGRASVNGDASYLLVGEGDLEGVGAAVAAGDVDGDGLSDMLIGASGYYDSDGEGGRVYLVRGAVLAGLTAVQAIRELDYAFTGSGAQLWAGEAVAMGDFNGDGLDDLFVANRWYSGGYTGYAWALETPTQAPGSR